MALKLATERKITDDTLFECLFFDIEATLKKQEFDLRDIYVL